MALSVLSFSARSQKRVAPMFLVNWVDRVMPKAAGAIEDLKAHDQMVCVGLMNSCKVQMEETIMADKGVAYCCPMDGRRKESRGKHDK